MVGAGASTVVLSGRHIVKTFRRGTGEIVRALDGVALTADRGMLTALVGPDGAGKTTLLRLVAGLMTADDGKLTVLGIDVAADPQQVQSRIGYMPQKFGLYEDLTVQENLDLYADLHGVTARQRQERYPRLMDMTALAPFTDRLAGRLSGGMKQKLGLACTLVRSPELLLLDEPTVGVDPLSRRELWEIIQQLVREEGHSVLLSTSYLDEAERCEHVVVLRQGTVLAEGRPSEVTDLVRGRTFLAEPAPGQAASVLQAQFLDDPQVVDAVPEGGRVRFVLTESAVTVGQHEEIRHGAAAVEPVEARFEDGFMALVRQATSEPRVAGAMTLDRPPAGTRDEVVVQVHDLVRRFGAFTAVDHVNFEVRRGEIFGLLGPNGAGKTTTFRMLCGLLPATDGTLRVAGADLRHARASARQRVGYVAQKFSLYGQLSVTENLEFFASAYGLYGARRRDRIKWALAQFELTRFANLQSDQLPGGYRQRLAMAASLLHEPEILFLDEPTSGADPLARREFWRRITALAQQGVTVIVTTHFMEEAEYCDRIVIMDAGRVLAQGTPAEVRGHARPEPGRAPTMEDAFVAIVEEARQEEKPTAAHAKSARAAARSFGDFLPAKLRRIGALVRKETRQLIRDPSSIAIGVMMPVLLILLFGYGLSLDVKNVPVAVVLEDPSPEAAELAARFQLSRYFDATLTTSMPRALEFMLAREVDGIVRIRPDFARHLQIGDAEVQILVHGTDSNRARIIQNYAQAAVGQWGAQRAAEGRAVLAGPVGIQERLWFNEANESRYFLVPGLVVLIMTLIGALLTALVMAREWERGTLEAIFVTPVRTGEILLGKTIPYFGLGMIGLALCIVTAKLLFHVPLRGSVSVLSGASMLYLLVALAIGLLISSAFKSQFVASQVAILVTFLPAMMLSGFLFDLRSMPTFVWLITYALPARYFVALLQTAFLAGNVWAVYIPNLAVLAVMAVVLLVLARLATTKKLA
ncbi:MAG: ABC transporter ATP-binding protein/permease [Planctomycetia bacterium]|nr:ABC transporter ATP-binding protein/permease [Planctomycetia bacterium]